MRRRSCWNRAKQPVLPRVAEPTTWLGNWYGTALFWRPQLTLLVDEGTLFPVLMPLAPAATPLDGFPEAFGGDGRGRRGRAELHRRLRWPRWLGVRAQL
jgi:hypothetical protein